MARSDFRTVTVAAAGLGATEPEPQVRAGPGPAPPRPGVTIRRAAAATVSLPRSPGPAMILSHSDSQAPDSSLRLSALPPPDADTGPGGPALLGLNCPPAAEWPGPWPEPAQPAYNRRRPGS